MEEPHTSKIEEGMYCLCRISVEATLAAHLTPPQTPESASSFQNPDLAQIASQMKKKPKFRPCLIFGIIGNKIGLLHVSSFDGNPRPDPYVAYYLPISPNAASGESSIETTPTWRSDASWQYCGYPEPVLVGKVKTMGPPTTISKASMSDLLLKQNQLKPKDRDGDEGGSGPNYFQNREGIFNLNSGNSSSSKAPEPKPLSDLELNVDTNNRDQDDSDYPLVFTPVVDLCIGAIDFTVGYDFEYSFDDEVEELGKMIDSIDVY